MRIKTLNGYKHYCLAHSWAWALYREGSLGGLSETLVPLEEHTLPALSQNSVGLCWDPGTHVFRGFSGDSECS